MGKICPEWVYSFQMTPHRDPSYMCRFCVSLERKGASILILIHFESFINFGISSTLRITTMAVFYINLSFIGVGKADLFVKVLRCQECQKPDARHIFLQCIQCSKCSEIPGFPVSKFSLLFFCQCRSVEMAAHVVPLWTRFTLRL